MVSDTMSRSFTTGCTRGVCLVVVKLLQSLFCTRAVRVAAGFEVLIHGSVTGCGQRWDTPVTKVSVTSIPLVLWTEEILGVGFLYLLNFNGWQ